MIYLLGVDHQVQHDRRLSVNSGFEKYVVSFCEFHCIEVIAEEFSVEAKTLSKVDTSVAEDIGEKLGLVHCFCDPTTAERAALNITKESIDAREYAWLNRLQEYKHLSVLFICGKSHLESFLEKAITSGYSVLVCSQQFSD